MDYNKLKTFTIVAELNSISAAAHQLRRTQPAITMQLQALEEELELKLLERRNARVFLSPEGERLYRRAKEKLGAIDDEVMDIRQASKTAEGHIIICSLNDFGTNFDIGSTVGAFCRLHPKITFSIRHVDSPDLIEEKLASNEIDMGFLVVFKQKEMFHRFAVQKSRHSLYASQAYLSSIGGIDSYKQLPSKALIDLTDDFLGLRLFLEKNSPPQAAALKERRPDIIAPNLGVVKQIVLSGYGISMLPDFLVSKEVQSGKLVKVFSAAKPLYGTLDVAYRTNRTLRFCESLFIKYLRANYNEC